MVWVKKMIKIINELGIVVDEKKLNITMKSACEVLGQNVNKIVTILSFVSREKIQEINKEYRHKDKVTDVISFRMLDNVLTTKINKSNYPYDYDRETKKIFLGEIFICYDVAVEQSKEYGHSVEREINFLFAHGLLHLCGFDHEDDEERKLMNEYEDKIMAKSKLLR